MSPNEIFEAVNVIKFLLGVIGALLVVIGAVGGYFLKKIHDTVISDHEKVTKDHEKMKEIYPMVHSHEKVLTKLQAEHGLFHAEKTKI